MNDTLDPKKFNPRKLAESVLQTNPVLSDRIAASCGIKSDEVTDILSEVVKYLNLTAYYEQRLTPSLMVDYAWHEFILCTKAYSEFCQDHFGKYIHHHPGGTGKENRKQFRNTLMYYRKHFGEPAEKFWGIRPGAQSECGACAAVTEEK